MFLNFYHLEVKKFTYYVIFKFVFQETFARYKIKLGKSHLVNKSDYIVIVSINPQKDSTIKYFEVFK